MGTAEDLPGERRRRQQQQARTPPQSGSGLLAWIGEDQGRVAAVRAEREQELQQHLHKQPDRSSSVARQVSAEREGASPPGPLGSCGENARSLSKRLRFPLLQNTQSHKLP